MNTRSRILRFTSFLAIAALIVLVPAASASDAEEYLTAEEYIEQARPYLHLSCEAAWDLVEQDGDAFIELTDKISAIGFLNHDFDVKKLGELPKDELEKRQLDYYTAIGEGCKENPHNLLAGIVERALIDAFTEIQPDADDS